MVPPSSLSRRKMLGKLCGFGAAFTLLRTPSWASFQSAKSILVDDSHGGSDIKNEYNFGSATLGRTLAGKGWRVGGTKDLADFNPAVGLTPALLANFNLLIFNGRYAGPDYRFLDGELATIEDWVRKGGGLLVVGASANFGRGQTNPSLNPVIKPFGLALIDTQLPVNTVTTKLKHPHPVTHNVSKFSVISGTAVHGDPAGDVAWVGQDSVLNVAQADSGRVAAFGGGTAFMGQALNSKIMKISPPETIRSNSSLLVNLTRWLLKEDSGSGDLGHF